MNILHKKAFPFDEVVRFIGLKNIKNAPRRTLECANKLFFELFWPHSCLSDFTYEYPKNITKLYYKAQLRGQAFEISDS